MKNSMEAPSVQFSCSVMSDYLQPDGLQHSRSPCPSPTPRVHPNLCPLSRWCHLTTSSSVLLLLPLIFPSNRVFSNESAFCIRWPEYWSFSFSISPSYLLCIVLLWTLGCVYLFEWISSLHQVARVLEFQLQHQSFQWTLRTDFL